MRRVLNQKAANAAVKTKGSILSCCIGGWSRGSAMPKRLAPLRIGSAG